MVLILEDIPPSVLTLVDSASLEMSDMGQTSTH